MRQAPTSKLIDITIESKLIVFHIEMSSLSKLRNVELADGWTFVTRSKCGRHSGKWKTPSAKPAANAQDAPLDYAHVCELTEDVRLTLASFEESVRASASVLALLRATASHPLKSAFCLGLGSLASGTSANQKRSVAQLAGFFWLMDNVWRAKSPDVFEMHAIDPHFSPTDKAVFEHFGVRVHLDSKSQHVSAIDGSLCYAPFLPWPVLILEYLLAGERKHAVLVCQDLQSVKENLQLWKKQLDGGGTINADGRECTKDDLVRGIEGCDGILKEYRATCFPPYEPLPFAFKDLVVYVRELAGDGT